MALPWQTVARGACREGLLELRRRGEGDYLITLAGRVLMNSRARRSEEALAAQGCAHLAGRPRPRILIGGLGMGITLRATLDAAPPDARVRVAELNPLVERWCSGPLATLNGHALADPRVRVELGDVSATIAGAARRGGEARFDAILLDLYAGPHARTAARRDPFYGSEALARSREALTPGGALAVWAEAPDRGFEARLRAAGFEVQRSRPGRGGLRHAVYVARRAARPTRDRPTRVQP